MLTFKRVLCAVDFSPTSRRAADPIARRAPRKACTRPASLAPRRVAAALVPCGACSSLPSERHASCCAPDHHGQNRYAAEDGRRDELRGDPKVNAARIGVTVDKGAVALLGTVDTYPEMWAAEAAAKRVSGVRTLAQDLTVKLLSDHKRSDSEIATAVQTALQWDVYVPNTVTARVQQGMVTLEGECASHYEREAAERAIRYLSGVVSVFDAVTIKPTTSAAAVKEKVEAALQRQATADASSIHIDTAGGKVTLTGHASSWRSMEDAAQAAWAAPGVTEVVDNLTISLAS